MLPELQNTYIPEQLCSSEKGSSINLLKLLDINIFFENNKKQLEKPCKDFRLFSHCQPHYLFQFDINSRTCHSYYHEPCRLLICEISNRYQLQLYWCYFNSAFIIQSFRQTSISFR